MLLQISWLITYYVVVLHKNSSKSLTTCISTHHKIFFWVYNIQYWYTCEKILQLLEDFFTPWCPFKFYSLPLQRSDWMCNLGESLNESPILSCKSHKISYICHILWSRPIHNVFNLVRVHRYTLFWDNVTQILNSISIEVTLAQLCIQLLSNCNVNLKCSSCSSSFLE